MVASVPGFARTLDVTNNNLDPPFDSFPQRNILPLFKNEKP